MFVYGKKRIFTFFSGKYQKLRKIDGHQLGTTCYLHAKLEIQFVDPEKSR